MDYIINNLSVIGKYHEELGEFPNIEEVEPDLNGYWVRKKLWDGKPTIIEWLKLRCGKAQEEVIVM